MYSDSHPGTGFGNGFDGAHCPLLPVRTAHDAALQTVRLEVADDGPGIKPAARRRLFEPYYSTKDGGTGLGLAIAQGIVQAHGGKIVAVPREGGGAIFRISIPSRRGERA